MELDILRRLANASADASSSSTAPVVPVDAADINDGDAHIAGGGADIFALALRPVPPPRFDQRSADLMRYAQMKRSKACLDRKLALAIADKERAEEQSAIVAAMSGHSKATSSKLSKSAQQNFTLAVACAPTVRSNPLKMDIQAKACHAFSKAALRVQYDHVSTVIGTSSSSTSSPSCSTRLKLYQFEFDTTKQKKRNASPSRVTYYLARSHLPDLCLRRCWCSGGF